MGAGENFVMACTDLIPAFQVGIGSCATNLLRGSHQPKLEGALAGTIGQVEIGGADDADVDVGRRGLGKGRHGLDRSGGNQSGCDHDIDGFPVDYRFKLPLNFGPM